MEKKSMFLNLKVIHFGKLFLLFSFKSFPFWITSSGCKFSKIIIIEQTFNR